MNFNNQFIVLAFFIVIFKYAIICNHRGHCPMPALALDRITILIIKPINNNKVITLTIEL